MENFQQFFLTLSFTEQQALIEQMSAVSATQKPAAQLEMKRELESPESPFQGKGRKVSTYLRLKRFNFLDSYS